jgi:glycosyltransferase involved in cell wall biosynthesis
MAPAPADSKRVAIFTICSNNYMPFARVLFGSVRRHHPEAELFLCLADRTTETAGSEDSDWTVIEAHDLPIPDFSSFAFRYHILEFNTALKPFMFLHLLDDRGFDAAIYFDPDIELFAPLTTVLAELHAGASFFFTPHLCSPSEDRGEPNDITIMRAGTYNLGFLGVSRNEEATRLLGWWARRLRYQCIDAQADGLFVDQKFMNLMPCFAPGAIVSRDTTLNVAYWNLQQRELGYTGRGWTVDGAPLTFFHFSGFDPRVPTRLSKHDPRFVDDLPEPLQKLTAHYAECLLARGYGAFPGVSYAYGQFVSGTTIHPTIRKMFRDWNPFWEADPFDGYEAFLHEPWPDASRASPNNIVTNFMRFLQGVVPRLGNLDLLKPEHVEVLIRWFVNNASNELNLDPALVEPAAARLGQLRRPLAIIPPKQDGGETDVTFSASFRATGTAKRSALLTFHAFLASGLAVEMRDVTSRVIQDNAPVRVICLAADQMTASLPAWASQSRSDALRILVPLWDLAWFPPAALSLLDLVHEVWAPSRFIQASLAGRTDRPVIHMPMAVELDPVAVVPRSQLGLPDDRFVLFSPFDGGASTGREDPGIAIRAFRMAFPQRGRACLALVSHDGSLAPDQRANLEMEISRDPDILLMDHRLSPQGMPGLMLSCDAVLWLTRSEGLGISIAEAMLLNRPVIATRYSASGEFVTKKTGYPVDYRLVPFEDEAHPTEADRFWAEVDLGHAAWIMRRLQEEPQRAAPLVAEARDYVRRNHSRDKVAAMQKARLSELSMQRT